jgi:hypothetical protein
LVKFMTMTFIPKFKAAFCVLKRFLNSDWRITSLRFFFLVSYFFKRVAFNFNCQFHPFREIDIFYWNVIHLYVILVKISF